MRCPSLREGAAAAHASDVCSIHVLRPRRQPQRLRKKRIVAAAIFAASNVSFLSLLLSFNKSKVYSNFKRHGNTRPVVITSSQTSRVRTGDLDHFGCLLEPEDGTTLPKLGLQVGPKSVFWRNCVDDTTRPPCSFHTGELLHTDAMRNQMHSCVFVNSRQF